MNGRASGPAGERRPRPSDEQERRSGWDRRAYQRRRVQLAVSSDQRILVERRSIERRRGAAVLPFPRAWGTPTLRAVVEETLEQVQQQWSNQGGEAASAAEVAEFLHVIYDALLLGARRADARLRSPLGRRLLELVRAELVRLVARRGQVLPAVELWQLMEEIEEVRAAIEPPGDQFASQLAGPGGLDLVVEVAHDLRSPLTSVLFLAEVLAQEQSGPVNEIQRRQLRLIYSAALGLTELTGDVIELARGGNRLTDGGPAPFSIVDLMTSVHDIVLPMAEEKGIEVRVHPAASDHRIGHAVALSRVLLNLTSNALKFTSAGYVELAAHQLTPSRVEFSVRDTGPGINQHAADTLYSPFRRASTGAGFMFSGTGLGLGLCRKLVSVMGSRLEVESRPGWGTRFYFTLDLPISDSL